MRKIDTRRFIYIRLVHKATGLALQSSEDEKVFQRPPSALRHYDLYGQTRAPAGITLRIFILYSRYFANREQARCLPTYVLSIATYIMMLFIQHVRSFLRILGTRNHPLLDLSLSLSLAKNTYSPKVTP